jgi:hypothetical protein
MRIITMENIEKYILIKIFSKWIKINNLLNFHKKFFFRKIMLLEHKSN